MRLIILTFLINLIVYQNLKAQSPGILKLHDKIKTSTSQVKRCEYTNRLGFSFLREGNSDSALYYIFKARKMALEGIQKTKDYDQKLWQIQLGLSYNYEGACHSGTGDLRKSMACFDSCFKSIQTIAENDTIKSAKTTIGYAYINQGNALEQLGEYPKALNAHFKALKIFEQINDLRNIAACYHNIAIVYGDQKNYKEALRNYEEALKINIARKDTDFIINNLSTLGTHFVNTKEYDKARESINRAMELSRIIENDYSLLNCYANLGVLCMDENKIDEAIVNYKKALEYLKRFEDLIALAGTSINIGEAYRLKGDLKNAEVYVLQGVEWAKQSGMAEFQYNGYFQLSELYSQKKEFEKSLYAYKRFSQIKDSLLNEENIRKGTEEKMNYEFDKKEAVAKIEQEKRDLQSEAEKKQQKTIIYSVSLGFILMLILAVVIFRSLRLNKKKNKIITMQKEMVEMKQSEILDSIRYAHRIQSALITSERYFLKELKRLRNK